MKRKIYQISLAIIFAMAGLFVSHTSYAQVPDAINFQAIARDADGVAMPNTNIMIRLTVLDGSETGTEVYREVRSLTTNTYGSFSFQIGRDAYITEGNFSEIDWASNSKFLKVDYDPTTSLNFELSLGVIEFVTVPYAFAAREVLYIDASGAVEGDVLVYNSATGKFEPKQIGVNVELDWDNIQNKPDFATVATSGSYNDLSDTPELFSGNYDDLTNKPIIPAVPQNISEFTNDTGYLTEYTETDPQFNAWDKDYNDLTNKPTIPTVPTNVSEFTNDAGYLTEYTETDPEFTAWDKDYNDLTNTPDLFSGSYDDLTNKPTIPTVPTNVSEFTNDAGYLTEYTETDPEFTAWDKDYNDLTNKPDLFSGNYNDLINTPTIPTVPQNVSEFNNDAGYLTNYTETDPQFNAWDKDYNDLTNKPTGNNVGDIQYWDGTNWILLPAGTQGQVLRINSSNIPEWQTSVALGLNPPYAQSLPASNIEAFEAQINAEVNANGLTTNVEFQWGTTTDYGHTAITVPSTITGVTNTNISTSISGLQSNTTYHYRIKATNSVDITYSNDMSFTTALSAPQLTTNAITENLGLSAVSGGNITYDGGTPVTTRGVCWSTSPNPTTANTHVASGDGVGSFSINLTNLTYNTTYYVRAYATNAVGTSYGNERSFTTIALPSLTTSGANDIKGNSAKAGGTISNNGGSAITAQGLCWSTSQNPTIANNTTTSFDAVMTGLSPNTTYYVRSYATNIAGTGYGEQISFNSGHIIGSSYAGGLVFYNNGAGGGLVCAESDQGQAAWGCYGSLIGGTSTAINTGAANTNAIVAACTTEGIAAKLCYDLTLNTYSDWYLPSFDELKLMYNNLHTQNMGGFVDAAYWSSSEYSGGSAWTVGFSNGSSFDSYDKGSAVYGRAVRAF